MNNRSLLSCRNEIKQNFMAHSYAGYLRESDRSLRTMRRRVPFFKKEKSLATLSSRKLIKQN